MLLWQFVHFAFLLGRKDQKVSHCDVIVVNFVKLEKYKRTIQQVDGEHQVVSQHMYVYHRVGEYRCKREGQ